MLCRCARCLFKDDLRVFEIEVVVVELATTRGIVGGLDRGCKRGLRGLVMTESKGRDAAGLAEIEVAAVENDVKAR